MPLPVHLLSPFINFLYTGNLEINATNAVEVLEAVELLQLEGEHEVVREEVSKVLEVELNQCTSLEALFPLWDTAVTFSLNCLLDRLLEIVAARIQLWTLSEKDVQWIKRLGWEEMHQVWKNKQGNLFEVYFLALQILGRDDLCVESEGVLLDLVLRWAEDKVREFLSSSGWS